LNDKISSLEQEIQKLRKENDKLKENNNENNNISVSEIPKNINVSE